MNISRSFGHWLAGFTDGEGCFVAKVTTGPPLEIRCEFSIILRQDDRQILVEIRDRLGMGILTDYGIITNRFGVRSHPRTRLRISRQSDCLLLADLFRRFPLRAKKARDLKTWTAILKALERLPRGNRWDGPTDRSSVVEMVTQLRSERMFGAA